MIYAQFRTAILAAAVAPLLHAADPTLLSLLMPDAKVIAGARVDQAKNSAFGAFVLKHLQPDDPNFIKFVEATGFDPRRDVTEIVMASNFSQNDPSHWLVVAKGAFDPARILTAAAAAGGVITKFNGIQVITANSSSTPSDARPLPNASNTAIAFLDSSTAAMGDISAVQGAIQRRKTVGGVGPRLAAKIQQVSAKNDFWFTTLVPLSNFASAMPDPNLSQAMKGNLLAAVQQASGGIKFGPTIQVNGEAITRSPQDASALVDVVKFIAGLIQTNRQKDVTSAQVSTLLDALQASAQGNTMTMTLAVPEATLEQMIKSMRQQRQKPASPAPPQQ